MKRKTLIALAAMTLLGGCAALKRDEVGVTENNLTIAGFTALPVSTPERAHMMATLPPDHVSQRFEGEHVSYLYPDPIICNCLYVGNQAAWGRYLAAAQARQTPVVTYQVVPLNPGFGWDWGPWGGYGPGYY